MDIFRSASYFTLRYTNGKFEYIYDEIDISFHIVNFPFLGRHIWIYLCIIGTFCIAKRLYHTT